MEISKIIYDTKGNFQWTSIVATVAFITAIITAIISLINVGRTNNSNLKGNVAKARIEWIQEVRKKSADFITACYEVYDFLELQGNDEQDTEIKKEITRLKNEVRKNGTLLILYFGPDSSENNDIIAIMVHRLIKVLTNKTIWEKKKKEDLVKVLGYLDTLKDFLRIYFKAEWKRANGELKGSKIQEYLRKHSVFESIFNIYYPELEDNRRLNERYYKMLARNKRP